MHKSFLLKKESIKWLENLQHSMTLLKEPERCIHVGDRESDIYELYCKTKDLNTHFLVRTCVNRLAGEGDHTIEDEMDDVRVKGQHRFNIATKDNTLEKIILDIKYKRIKVLPPVGKQKKYPGIMVSVIHAEEHDIPKGRDKICWKLITDFPINNRAEAIEKLQWYSLRWKIETFHKILKSGFKAEASRLHTAQRITNLIAILCILSWRLLWMTILNRSNPRGNASLVFTRDELQILSYCSKNKLNIHILTDCILQLAKLGGYLARHSDPPPGNMVLWRGLTRLMDIQTGYAMASENCG
jgi:hypothetical protein